MASACLVKGDECIAKFEGPKEKDRSSVISFNLKGVHSHDVAAILDNEGIAVRGGHHCAMPLMEFLGVPALSRASVWVYNTPGDVEALVSGVERAIRILRK